jgi:hypothetical protein
MLQVSGRDGEAARARPQLAASTMPCAAATRANSTSRSRPATSLESTRSCGSRHQPVAPRVPGPETGRRRSCQPSGATAVSGPTPWA